MARVHGMHHVTAIAGPPQENLDFYTRTLGMRLVKRSVNQDDPGTYHLFYADAAGSPGTDLTFFPWPAMHPRRNGTGLAVEVGLAVAPDTLGDWARRLGQAKVDVSPIETRFGERVLALRDPHGLEIALVETANRPFEPWPESPVPAELQIRGLHHARLWEHSLERTADFIESSMGFSVAGEEGGWHRYESDPGGSGAHLDIRELPDERRGAWGTGSVHHIAWRVRDDAEQLAVRGAVEQAGRNPTEVIDRFWFKSVYFLEPGGVLFELATDGPGFAVDEDPQHLGEQLILPPWLEPHRKEIEKALPTLS
jgi:glyoxalase family protein